MKRELKEKIEDLVLELIDLTNTPSNKADRGKKFREMKKELFDFIDSNVKE